MSRRGGGVTSRTTAGRAVESQGEGEGEAKRAVSAVAAAAEGLKGRGG